MMSAFKFHRLLIAVCLAGILTSSLEGVSPVRRDVPPQEALELLDLLARGDVRAPELRPIVRRIVMERYGSRGRVGVILGEAVKSGEVSREVIEAALEAEGCPVSADSMAGQCGSLAASFRASLANSTKVGLVVTGTENLVEERERTTALVLKAETESPAGNAAFRASYARAVISQSESPLASALAYSIVSSHEELPDIRDREVFRAMGRVTVGGKTLEQLNPAPFRAAFAVAFRDRIERAHGDPTVVAEVRALPEDLLTRARQVDAQTTSPFMGEASSVACVLEAWRKEKAPPNRWVSWKAQLVCQGW